MKRSTVIIIAVIVAIAGFAGGTFYGKASVSARTATAGGRGAFAGGAGASGTGGAGGAGFIRGGVSGAGGAGFATGQVIAEDSQSITLQLPNGNSEVVFYSPSTQIMVMKTSAGAASDLAVGTTVIVSSSTANADGSITASAIQVRQGGAPGSNEGFPRTSGQ